MTVPNRPYKCIVGGGIGGQISCLVSYLAASCSVSFSTINDPQ